MPNSTHFDALIIGGSYAGLSAAMTLGRAIRKVLIIDSGNPCNKQTPHAHNLLTHDGVPPQVIAAKAKEQVLAYPTISFHTGFAVSGTKTADGFEITTQAGEVFRGKKLLIASGVRDIMPDIAGFAECWGISVLHCPYCHGYEVKDTRIALLGNGDMGYELSRLLSNWSRNLVLLTNAKSALSPEQTAKLASHSIPVIEKEIAAFEHQGGMIRQVVFADNSVLELDAVFARPAFVQHSDIPQQLGCALTEQGFLQIDEFQKTSVAGIYAAGDTTTQFRTLSMALAAGTKAGAVLNKELIDEEF